MDEGFRCSLKRMSFSSCYLEYIVVVLCLENGGDTEIRVGHSFAINIDEFGNLTDIVSSRVL